MGTLYDLLKEYEAIEKACYDPEIDAEALLARLEALNDSKENLHEKVDNIVKILRNLKADAKSIAAEEQRLARRRQAIENKAQRIRDWTRDLLIVMDAEQIKTTKNTVTVGPHAKRVIVTDESLVPEVYHRVTVEIDRRAVLRDHRETGEIPPGTDIVNGPRPLVIR